MALTGKQKRTLRGMGQKMQDDLRLGGGGISAGFRSHLDELLRRKELVKLRLGDTDIAGSARQALADEVAGAAGAECIAVLGRTVLLYRASPELAPGQRVLKE